MATIKERDFFAKDVLLPIGENANQLRDNMLTGFLSMQGSLYNNELMVVGRAVNGWTDGIRPDQLADPMLSEKYADNVLSSVIGEDKYCPLTWVTECWGSSEGYNSKRSAFWRVIRAVVDNLGIANIDKSSWPSYLVWSNLYKVAPSKGGNPNNTLCDIQFDGCLSLLELELSIYTPKRLLFLTGWDWAIHFFRNFETKELPESMKHVEAIAQLKTDSDLATKVVVASHPQGKIGKEWVAEVIEAFNK